jgi:hypothetical protein
MSTPCKEKTMFIEVLYADLSRQRVPVAEADKLPKTGVLAVVLSCPDPEKPRATIDGVGYRRIAQKHRYDYYYLLKYMDDGSFWYGLEGRGNENLVSFRKDSEKPLNASSLRKEHPRYNCWSLVFEGQHVDEKTWAKAVEVFEEIH